MPGPSSSRAAKKTGNEESNRQDDNTKSANNNKSAIVPEGFLPSYLAEAFADLYGEDGLLVLGKGLGWLSLLAVFVRFYGDVHDGHASLVRDGGNDEDEKDVNNKRGYFYSPEWDTFVIFLRICMTHPNLFA